QSDNNQVLDVNEATEFTVTLVTSINMSKVLHKYLKEEFNCEVDQFDRIAPECFRQNFYQGFCQNYRSYYPKLFDYLGAKKCTELENSAHNMLFLNTSIKAARSCNHYPDGAKEEVYYSEG